MHRPARQSARRSSFTVDVSPGAKRKLLPVALPHEIKRPGSELGPFDWLRPGDPVRAELTPSLELIALLSRRFPPGVNPGRKVGDVNAFGCLLATVGARDRQVDFALGRLPCELCRRHVLEVVAANEIERNDRLGVVLRHEDESGVHTSSPAGESNPGLLAAVRVGTASKAFF